MNGKKSQYGFVGNFDLVVMFITKCFKGLMVLQFDV